MKPNQFASSLHKILMSGLCSILFFFSNPIIVISKDQGLDPFEKRLTDSVKKTTLKNGLRVLTVTRKKIPTVSLYIRLKVGSVDESYDTTGTAHLLEHMLFKGTRTIGTNNWQKEKKILSRINTLGRALDYARINKYSSMVIKGLKAKLSKLQKEHKKFVIKDAFDAIYNRNGAVGFNASTSTDLTTYKINLPKNRIEIWAYIESERLKDPILREYFLERDVVVEERRMRTDSRGSGLLYERFIATAFQAHPYRHPIIGWKSSISYLNLDKTYEFFRKYYVPNNMVITAVGDIDHDEFLGVIKKYFGKLQRGPELMMPEIQEPVQNGEKRVNFNHQDNPRVIIGYHKPNILSREDFVFDIIDQLLTTGRTSLMYKELIMKKRIASGISSHSSLPGSRYPNLFAIFASPRAPHSPEKLESSIYKVIDKFITEPISKRDLQKVKNRIEAQFIYGLRSNTGLASSLSYYEILVRDWKYLLNYRQVISGITEKEIKSIAKKYLRKANRTVAILNQIKNK